MFSQSFLQFLITGSLIWTGIGVITLLALAFKDWLAGTLW